MNHIKIFFKPRTSSKNIFKQSQKNIFFLFNVLLPLFLGLLIYTIGHPSKTIISSMVNCLINIDELRPFMFQSWVYFHLPDFFWAYAFSSCILFFWNLEFNSSSIAYAIISIFVSVALEVLVGTFDPIDLILLGAGSILPIIILMVNEFKITIKLNRHVQI